MPRKKKGESEPPVEQSKEVRNAKVESKAEAPPTPEESKRQLGEQRLRIIAEGDEATSEFEQSTTHAVEDAQRKAGELLAPEERAELRTIAQEQEKAAEDFRAITHEDIDQWSEGIDDADYEEVPDDDIEVVSDAVTEAHDEKKVAEAKKDFDAITDEDIDNWGEGIDEQTNTEDAKTEKVAAAKKDFDSISDQDIEVWSEGITDEPETIDARKEFAAITDEDIEKWGEGIEEPAVIEAKKDFDSISAEDIEVWGEGISEVIEKESALVSREAATKIVDAMIAEDSAKVDALGGREMAIALALALIGKELLSSPTMLERRLANIAEQAVADGKDGEDAMRETEKDAEKAKKLYDLKKAAYTSVNAKPSKNKEEPLSKRIKEWFENTFIKPGPISKTFGFIAKLFKK